MPHEVVQNLCCCLPTSPSLSSWEGHFPGAMLPPSSFDSVDFEHDVGAGGPCPTVTSEKDAGPCSHPALCRRLSWITRPLGLFPGHPGSNASRLGLLVPGLLVKGCRRS
ncbi:unnamed protein product [Rangifer tarandus platyrhynchus]|uniref:Uncharacterized protein n=1 Tax=Rangifer tarandus platyrhynchus TaxID=3082113 RepID=A0ABN8YPK4_RANTA|nr:unnamed protein product [Rangifer tarandus platyrhynchus]